MAYDGNGNFLRIHNWVQDKNNAIDITASEMDAEDNGFAAGLTLAVTRDGQGKMATNFLSTTDASFDIGSNSVRWANGWFSGNVTVNGQVIATGNISGAAGTFTGLTVNLLPVRGSLNVFKTASTPRSNTTTLANDPDLIISLSASTKYRIEIFMAVQCSTTTTQGFKSTCNYTGTFTQVNSGVTGVVNSLTFAQKTDFGNLLLTNISITNTDFILFVGYFNTNTSGTFSLQWAQNSSSANATTLGAGSYLIATPIG